MRSAGASHALFWLLAALLLAFAAGALSAYPIYSLFPADAGVRFERILSRAVLGWGLVGALLYAALYGRLSPQALGLDVTASGAWRHSLRMFAAGALVAAGFALTLLFAGVNVPDPGRDGGAAAFFAILVKAAVTGLLVALIEEILFRGALFRGLRAGAGAAAAVVGTGLLYAAVHFIKYPAPAAAPDWSTGLALTARAFGAFANFGIADAFASLLALGVLLGMIRERTGSLLPCVGFHAGLVMLLKISGYLTDYDPGNNYPWLVNAHDHQLGFAALCWLGAACIAYAFIPRREP